MASLITDRIRESIEVKERILSDDAMIMKIQEAGKVVRKALSDGNKILLCGNGGSASDSLHIRVNLSGDFKKKEGRFRLLH